MVEKEGKYPVYFRSEERKGIESHKAMVALTYAQLLEIANVLYYFSNVVASRSPFFGGLRIPDDVRTLHKAIHNACINCCLSLEEADRVSKEGGKDGIGA